MGSGTERPAPRGWGGVLWTAPFSAEAHIFHAVCPLLIESYSKKANPDRKAKPVSLGAAGALQRCGQ